MIKCKICGREFKSPQALGGHMRNAHVEEAQTVTASDNGSGNPGDIGETAGESREPVVETALLPQDASQSEQIRAYLKLGYTVKQLTDQFGFSETTVRQEIAKVVQPEGEAFTRLGLNTNKFTNEFQAEISAEGKETSLNHVAEK